MILDSNLTEYRVQLQILKMAHVLIIITLVRISM